VVKSRPRRSYHRQVIPKPIEQEEGWAPEKATGIRNPDRPARSLVAAPTTCKGKAIPLQSWTGPEGSSRLRLPDLMTIGK